MEFKIEIPDEMIQKMISEKLEGMNLPQVKKPKPEPINAAEYGQFFGIVMEAAKVPRKDNGVRTGIRFKFGDDVIETSLNTATKAEATQMLKKYGISISKFCNAALEVILAEERALEISKKNKAVVG